MNTDIEDGDPTLGRGLAFPLRLASGQVGMNAHDSQVRQSILVILRTGQGERLMRPDFGGGMHKLAFEPMSSATVAVVQHRVQDTLARFEPRIEVLGVAATALADAGQLSIDIRYRVRRTNSVANLVYPFYIERGDA
jgi:phage baseplate assembly protein W